MKNDRMWGGVLLIFLGLVFLGSNLWDYNAAQLMRNILPTLLIIFGVWIFKFYRHAVILSVMLVLFGLLWSLGNLGVLNISIFSLWPILLVGLGVNVLLQKNSNSGVSDDTESLTDTTMFAGSKKVITSSNFKTAKLTTLFGGSELDLSEIKVKGDIEVEAVVLCGELKLRVPNNTEIVNNVSKIAAEVKDQRSSHQKSAEAKNKVTVNGVVTMGSLEIS